MLAIAELPLLPRDFPMTVARNNNPNVPGEYKDFKMNKNNISIWLAWLKSNNSH